jgi:hypothetical protein
MAIDINIPSQVKNYANLAAFPATGALKTIYIANDNNKTYRWTGSVYVEISGTDTSSLVPTSRTLTINGTTQDLSADRTFTISTGITIGTTAITSGTVGRVLFEGTGNVVQESANLFWDNTNGRLGIGTSSPAHPIDIRGANEIVKLTATGGGSTIKLQNSFGSTWNVGSTGNDFYWLYNGVSSFMTLKNNGNLLIGTTTDAGFRVDINGTARVTGNVRIVAPGLANNSLTLSSAPGSANIISFQNTDATTQGGFFGTGSSFNYGTYQPNQSNLSGGTGGIGIRTSNGANAHIRFYSGNADGDLSTEKMRLVASTGNLLINTTTDVASSKLTIESTTQGFLPPRMTTTQKNAIASPATGLMVYDTTLNLMALYNGTTWTTL